MRSLNSKQKSMYDRCMVAVTKPEPMRIFVSGGAGVGRSVLMGALEEGFTRYFVHCVHNLPSHTKVMKMAPTGSATFNINGSTVHSHLHVPINKTDKQELDTPILNRLCVR